ncbi:MAG: hypothetical protein ABI806_10660 [Candidatus Solibacter sp.]
MTHGFRALILCAFAGALSAQTPKPILGTVTGFKPFEILLKSDSGENVATRFGADTEVMLVPPGERDFSKATRAEVTDILAGDRVMASYVAGMPEARRIVLITSRDISKRNEAEKLDWQVRGINGLALSHNGNEVTVLVRTPEGNHEAVVTVTGKTNIRRYAPDSIKFTQAVSSTVAEIAAGDQVRARGAKSEDGKTLVADDVVFGTFLTRMGAITAVRRDQNEIDIQDVTTKKPFTIHIAGDSQMKKMPDLRAMMTGSKAQTSGDHAPQPTMPPGKPFDIQTAMQGLPAATFDDLKVGSAVVVTSTKGATPSTVTAIMLMANAGFLVQLAQGTGEGGADGIKSLHGGMLVAPGGGISLPTMIQ